MEDITAHINTIKEHYNSLNSFKEDGRLADVDLKLLRELIISFHKLSALPKDEVSKVEKLITNFNTLMLSILNTEELQFECQLVGAKVFCSGNYILHNFATSLKICTDLLNNKKQPEIDEKKNDVFHHFETNDTEVFDSTLCFALLETSAKMWDDDYVKPRVTLWEDIFPVCEKLSFKYSSTTLITFKTIVKMINILTDLKKTNYVIPDKYLVRLMNIIMANWDSQITGIREQCRCLFRKLVPITRKNQWLKDITMDEPEYSTNLFNCFPLLYIVINQQTWLMKSKYFMTSGIINKSNAYSILSMFRDDIVLGIKTSLQYTYLYNAGTELYERCIKNINFYQWKEIFLDLLVDIYTVDENRFMRQALSNYMMLPTIKEHPGSFRCVFIEVQKTGLKNFDSFSYLIKLGRREGHVNWGIHDGTLEKNLMYYDNIKLCLIHSDESIRSDIFSALCSTNRVINFPILDEIELIKQYLIQNVNYDCSKLRYRLINDCTLLFSRITRAFVFKLKRVHNYKIELLAQDHDFLNIIDFLDWLNKFLMDNLEIGCNFQRKYTSIALYEIILNHFNVSSDSKDNRGISGVDVQKLTDLATKLNRWNYTSNRCKVILFQCIMDPSEIIKNIAANILSSHFSFNLSDDAEMISLYRKGLHLCSNKLFFQSDSGVALIKTVISLAYKPVSGRDPDELLSKFLNGKKNIVGELLIIAENEKNELMKDILKAASTGSPLHGVLLAINGLLTDKKSPEFGLLNIRDIKRLLCVIEETTRKLLDALALSCSKITDFAPSFCDMGKSIEQIAHQSKIFGELNEDDGFHLSDAHLLIINCIWLNIKVCSSVATNLITSSLLDDDLPVIQRCIELIGSVLKKCRHKGAIESAGLNIMQVTKYLTSHHKLKFHKLPGELLDTMFSTLMNSNSASLSRTSAGLSILCHRIVLGDSRQKKPLLHSCMINLIKIINTKPAENVNYEKVDLPQSRALHFLCSLVEDSCMRHEVAHHISDITLLCFHNLSSDLWTIRNAALRLFGSLVPKLIGQKKLQENDSETYSVAFEELYFHMTNIFELIDKKLLECSNSTDIIMHSNLMPILTLFSNLHITVHSSINKKLKTVINTFSEHLENLLSSPIFHVRKLSAVILTNFCLPHNLKELIDIRCTQLSTEMKKTHLNQNRLYGLFLNLKLLLLKFYKLKSTLTYLDKFVDRIQNSVNKLFENHHIKQKENLSFFIRYVSSDVELINEKTIVEAKIHILKAINKIDENFLNLNYGSLLFYSNEINFITLKCKSDDIEHFTKLFLINSNINDFSISFLKSVKLKVKNNDTNNKICRYMINEFLNFTLTMDRIEVNYLVFDVLLAIIKKSNKNNYDISGVDNKVIVNIYEKFINDVKFGLQCASSALPVICSFISNKFPNDFINNVIKLICNWSNPNENNENLRLSSVECLNQLIKYLKLKEFDDEIGTLIWKSVCNFSVDEDKNIRIKITKFINKIFNLKFYNEKYFKYINPYVSLNIIYNLDNMLNLMTDRRAIKNLWDLLNYENIKNDKKILKNDTVINPFNHGVSNIYKEDIKVIELINNKIINTIMGNDNYKSLLQNIISDEKNSQPIDDMLSNLNIHEDKYDIDIDVNKFISKKKLIFKKQIVSNF